MLEVTIVELETRLEMSVAAGPSIGKVVVIL
jgi:hypothetical protein